MVWYCVVLYCIVLYRIYGEDVNLLDKVVVKTPKNMEKTARGLVTRENPRRAVTDLHVLAQSAQRQNARNIGPTRAKRPGKLCFGIVFRQLSDYKEVHAVVEPSCARTEVRWS